MKAVWKAKNGQITMCEVSEPVIVSPDDVKIKVLYNTIGTEDLRMQRYGDIYARIGIAGYEMVGVITDLGEQAKREGFAVGQSVTGTPVLFCGICEACVRGSENSCIDIADKSGTLCEYVIWKSRQLIRLDNHVSEKYGCLVEPVATVLAAMKRMDIMLHDTVCILGGDFLGITLLQIARMRGAGDLVLVDSSEHRRDLAHRLGANYTIDPQDENFETEMMRISDFRGFDVIVETSGDIRMMKNATDLIAKGGIMVLMSYFELWDRVSVNSMKFYYNNATISSSFLYTKRDLSQALKILPKLQLNEVISREYTFDKAIEAFEVVKSGLLPRVLIKM
jgi:2-desacetyl-2-hydroxyethyl bacteriochlorophyllide A dehydrogenase